MTAAAWVLAAERGVEVKPLDVGDLAGGVIAAMDGLDRLARQLEIYETPGALIEPGTWTAVHDVIASLLTA